MIEPRGPERPATRAKRAQDGRTVVRPHPDSWHAALAAAARTAAMLADRPTGQSGIESFCSRVRLATNRLAGTLEKHPTGSGHLELLLIAQAALRVAAEVIHALNDCLASGELNGYLMMTEENVADQVRQMTDAIPGVLLDGSGGTAIEYAAWLLDIDTGAVPLELITVSPGLRVAQAFVTIATASAFAGRLEELGR